LSPEHRSRAPGGGAPGWREPGLRGRAVSQVLPARRLRRHRPDAAPCRGDQDLRGRASPEAAVAGDDHPMKIAVLAGDGIGTEIVAQAERVLGALDLRLETEHALVGGAAYEAHGHPLPASTLALAKAADA